MTDFFEVQFLHNQFEKHNLAKLRNFRLPKSEINPQGPLIFDFGNLYLVISIW